MFKNKVTSLIVENNVNSFIYDPNIIVAKNRFIDIYLNMLNQRLGSRHNARVRLYGKLLASIYTMFISYNIICVFVEFPHEIRVLLFDISLVMGGIAKYINACFVCSFWLALAINSRLRLTARNTGIDVWTQMFTLMRTRVRLTHKSVDKQIVDKLVIYTQRVYKGLNWFAPCNGM